MELDHPEVRDVTPEFMQALDCPRRHDARQVAARNAVFAFEQRPIFLGAEKSKGRFMDRRTFDRIKRYFLDQGLEFLGKRGFPATNGAEQVENLLFLLKPLCGMADVGDDVLDDVFHAEKIAESRIDLDDFVGKETRLAGSQAGIDQFRLADRRQHALGDRSVGPGIAFAQLKVLRNRHLFFERRFIATLVAG